MSALVEQIDKALGEYYQKHGVIDDYYNGNNEGLFVAFCDRNGFDTDEQITEELSQDQIDDCLLLKAFEDNFPGLDAKKNEATQIFNILKQCVSDSNLSNFSIAQKNTIPINNDTWIDYDNVKHKANELDSECKSLHRFTEFDICNQVKWWLYNDIDYKKNLGAIMSYFCDKGIDGKFVSGDYWSKSGKIITKYLQKHTNLTEDTINIMFEEFDEWIKKNQNDVLRRSASEICLNFYMSPLLRLLNEVNSENVNGETFIKYHKNQSLWMKKLTGWNEADIYQINAYLFKHYTFKAENIKFVFVDYEADFVGNMDMNKLRSFIKENIKKTNKNVMKTYDELSKCLAPNARQSKREWNKQSDIDMTPIQKMSLALPFNANWECANCQCSNRVNYTNKEIKIDTSICTLCGIRRKDSVILRMRGYDCYFLQNEIKMDENEDEIIKQVQRSMLYSANGLDISCPDSLAEHEPCRCLLNVAKYLLQCKTSIDFIHDKGKKENMKSFILKNIPNDKWREIFVECVIMQKKRVSEDQKQSILELLDGKLDIHKFLKGRREFIKLLTAKLNNFKKTMIVPVARALYKSVNECTQTEAIKIEKECFEILSSQSIDIQNDIKHILDIHIKKGNKTTREHTLKFINGLMHCEVDYYDECEPYLEQIRDRLHDMNIAKEDVLLIMRPAAEEEEYETDCKEDKFVTDAKNTKYSRYGFAIYHKHPLLAPIYDCLMEEMSNNNVQKHKFESKLAAAVEKQKEAKDLICQYFDSKFNILRNEPIGILHILAITFYTDETNLCRAFRSTYRRIDGEWNDDQVTARHRQFYHFGRSLFEAIEFFGQEMSEETKVYHGLNKVMNFEEFTAYFNQPISTTTNFEKAKIFARNGITLVFTRGIFDASDMPRIPKYLSVKRFSAFPQEEELLFYGENVRLEIFNIYYQGNSYRQEVESLNMLQRIIENQDVNFDTKQNKKFLAVLIKMIKKQKEINANEDDEKEPKSNSDVNEYGQALFGFFCNNQKARSVEIKQFESLPKELKNELFSDAANENNLSFVPIFILFGSLKKITFTDLCINIDQIELSKKYIESALRCIQTMEKMKRNLSQVQFQSTIQTTKQKHTDLKQFEREYAAYNKYFKDNDLQWSLTYEYRDKRHNIILITHEEARIQKFRSEHKAKMELLQNENKLANNKRQEDQRLRQIIANENIQKFKSLEKFDAEHKSMIKIDEDIWRDYGDVEQKVNALEYECKPLRRFDSSDICNEVKWWLYRDVDYKQRLSAVLTCFCANEIDGKFVCEYYWLASRESITKYLRKCTNLETDAINIMFEEFGEWMNKNQNDVSSKSALEIGFLFFSFPLMRLLNEVNSQSINGEIFIQYHKNRSPWMNAVTGWNEVDIYQINAQLFKHYAFNAKDIKSVLFDESINFEVESNFYAMRNNQNMKELNALIRAHIKKTNKNVIKTYDELSKCFVPNAIETKKEWNKLPKACPTTTQKMSLTLTFNANWDCAYCQCSNRVNYTDQKVKIDASICTLCGITRKDSVTLKMRGFDCYFLQSKIDMDENEEEIIKNVQKSSLYSANGLDISCPDSLNEHKPCQSILKVAMYLLQCKRSVDFIHGKSKNMKPFISKNITNEMFTKMCIDSLDSEKCAKEITKREMSKSQKQKILEFVRDEIDIAEFLKGKTTFRNTLKKKLKDPKKSNSIGKALYESIYECMKSEAIKIEKKCFEKLLSQSVEIQDEIEHISAVHIKQNKITKDHTLRFLNNLMNANLYDECKLFLDQIEEKIPFLYHSNDDNIEDDGDEKDAHEVVTDRFVTDSKYIKYGFGVDHKHPSLAPLYDSLMDEMCKNRIHRVDVAAFERMLWKAIVQQQKALDLICKYFDGEFNILRNETICVVHLLAISLYTDLTDLCTAFRATYRRINDEQHDNEVMERHMEFYHFGRSLFEAVEFFGEEMTAKTKVYHGLNKAMEFEQFVAYFNQPMSTTTSFQVARNFAKDGGITLRFCCGIFVNASDKSRIPKYLSVSRFSSFSQEDELLFYGNNVRFEIFDIYHQETQHRKQIKASIILQRIIKNEMVNFDTKKGSLRLLVSMIKNQKEINMKKCQINESKSNNDDDAEEKEKKSNSVFRDYGRALFTYFCNNQKAHSIEIKEFENLPKELQNELFYDESNGNNLSFVPIFVLFASLRKITFTDTRIGGNDSRTYIEAAFECIQTMKTKFGRRLSQIKFQSEPQPVSSKDNVDLKRFEFEFNERFQKSGLQWSITYEFQATKHNVVLRPYEEAHILELRSEYEQKIRQLTEENAKLKEEIYKLKQRCQN